MGDDAFRYGKRVIAATKDPGHHPSCDLIEVIRKGETRVTTYVCDCHPDCAHLIRAQERGRELAAEHGW